jgi:hypothetical protein
VLAAAVLGEPSLTHGAYVRVSVRDHASPNLRDDDDERDRANSSQQSPHADNLRQMEGAAVA